MHLTSRYLSCVDMIAQDLMGRKPAGHALLVAVDGRSGAGKTTFSASLVQTLISHGRAAACVSLDGFHNNRARRYARGRYSAEGYYQDARDLQALREMCLIPLGPEGSGRYATASFDLVADTPIEPHWKQAEAGLIIVVEGTFLLRPALNAHWDVRICLSVPEDIARMRGIGRDHTLLGEEAELLYRQRYEGAYTLYEAESSTAIESADWRVDLTNLDAPAIMEAANR